MNIVGTLFIFLISGIRPLLGPAQCRYTVGCTEFACLQLREKPFLHALGAICKRVLACNPLFKRSL